MNTVPRAVKATSLWRIEVVRPDWTNGANNSNDKTVYVFVPFQTAGQQSWEIDHRSRSGTPVVSLNYDLSLSEGATSFSFNLLPFDDYMSKIKLHDLVYFYDDSYSKASEPEFIGLIQDRRYTARMTDRGIVRSISFSGKSLAALVTDFSFLLDMRILPGVAAVSESQNLMSKLSQAQAEGAPYTDLIEKIKDAFCSLFDHFAPSGATGVSRILRTMLTIPDYGGRTMYPKIISPYTAGDVTLWDLIQSFSEKPWNETFFTFSNSGMELNVRPTPYMTPSGWAALQNILIDPVYITGIDLGNSTAEAYTVFSTTFPGPKLSQNLAYTDPTFRQGVQISDNVNWLGWKVLQVERRYIDRSIKIDATLQNSMKQSNIELKNMYANITDMLSGTIQTKPFQVPAGKKLQAGVRCSIIGLPDVAFYVESISRSWQTGQSFSRDLKVSRGGVYDSSGNWLRAADSRNIMENFS